MLPAWRSGIRIDAHCRGLLGPEPHVDIEDPQQASNQQARTDEQNAGEGDLGYDQQLRIHFRPPGSLEPRAEAFSDS